MMANVSLFNYMNFGEDLSLQVMLAHKSYQNYLNRILDHIDIYQYCQLILLLNRFGGRTTQKKLCEELRIEKTNMVAIIDLLQNRGYVTREVNYKDRRSKLITLTPKAGNLLENLDTAFNKLENNVTGEVTWQEMHNCLRVLKKMNDAFMVILTEKPMAKTSSFELSGR